MVRNLNQYSEFLVKIFEQEYKQTSEKGITVNPIVSELASWYEKLRNAIEYREDEVILRATIERILKRRLILGGTGKSVAEPLIRELIWARYFPDGSIEDLAIKKVEQAIDIHLALKKIIVQNGFKEQLATKITYQLASAAIEKILNFNIEKDTMSNLIFHIIQSDIKIIDDTEENRDAQVYIAVRRAYGKDDLAFLRYNLFCQFFGELTESNLETVANEFPNAFKEFDRQLNYRLRHKIYSYTKRQIPPFLILEELLVRNKGKVRELLSNEEELKNQIITVCQQKYNTIVAKVRRAVIRSVIFILLSKVFFAFTIEGTYEKYMYGKVLWGSIALNIIIPTFLMVATGLFIKTPRKDNTERIVGRIKSILFDPTPQIGRPLSLRLNPPQKKPFLQNVFNIFWVATYIVSFGLVVFVLTKLHFNFVSQGIFLFFLAIVSFLSFRINQTAHLYTVEDRPGLLTPIIDFFFMPIARVGRHLTEGISQINIFLFILDFIIETPFKGIVAFFEQLFFFLHSKRENLG